MPYSMLRSQMEDDGLRLDSYLKVLLLLPCCCKLLISSFLRRCIIILYILLSHYSSSTAMDSRSVLQFWASAELDNVQFSLSSSLINTLALSLILYLAFCSCQKLLLSKQQIHHGTAPQFTLPIDKMAQSFVQTPFDFLE